MSAVLFSGGNMSEKTVFERIYDVVRRIPSGKVATYGQIAMLAGNPRWARAVGYALHANPEPGVIPCHRVLNRFGKQLRRSLLAALTVRLSF